MVVYPSPSNPIQSIHPHRVRHQPNSRTTVLSGTKETKSETQRRRWTLVSSGCASPPASEFTTVLSSKHFLPSRPPNICVCVDNFSRSSNSCSKRLLQDANQKNHGTLSTTTPSNRMTEEQPKQIPHKYSDIIESVRCDEQQNYHDSIYNDDDDDDHHHRPSFSLHCVDKEGNGESNENAFESDGFAACETSSVSLLNGEAWDDEVSFSECIPLQPFCDFMLVSGGGNEESSSPLLLWNHQEKEEFLSHSLISGCSESVYCLEDNDAKPKADRVLLYCRVAKLGNQAAFCNRVSDGGSQSYAKCHKSREKDSSTCCYCVKHHKRNSCP